MKKKIKKIFVGLLILSVMITALGYFASQYTFRVPRSVIKAIQSFLLSSYSLKLDVDDLKINLSDHRISAKNLSFTQTDFDLPFLKLRSTEVTFVSGTGIFDFYHARAAIEHIKIDDVFLDPGSLVSEPGAAPFTLKKIPATQLLVSGLVVRVGASDFALEDFLFSYDSSGVHANFDLSYTKDPLGGSAKLDAIAHIETGQTRARLTWANENFASFVPLMMLRVMYGLGINSGNAAVNLNWNGNLHERISAPVDNLGKLLGTELSGSVIVRDCNLDYAGLRGEMHADFARVVDEPWKGRLGLDLGSSSVSLNAYWPQHIQHPGAFATDFSVKNLSFSTQQLQSLGIDMPDLDVGNIDLVGAVIGDGSDLTGSGTLEIVDCAYDLVELSVAKVLWKLNNKQEMDIDAVAKMNAGNIAANGRFVLAGENAGDLVLKGDFDNGNLSLLDKIVDAPVEGTASGGFLLSLNLLNPGAVGYEIDFSIVDHLIYTFNPRLLTGKLHGKGPEWVLADPIANFSDGSSILAKGFISQNSIKTAVTVNNVDLANFGLPDHIVSGRASLKADVGGSFSDIKASGEVRAKSISLMGQHVDTFKAIVKLDNEILDLMPIVAKPAAHAKIDGRFSINIYTGDILSFQLNFQRLGVDFVLPFLPEWLADTGLAGVLVGSIAFDQNSDGDQWDIFIDAHQIAIYDEAIDSIFFEGSIFGRQGEVRNLWIKAFGGSILLNGQILGAQQFEGSVEAESLSLNKINIVQKLIPDIQGEVSCQGSVEWDGPSKQGYFTLFGNEVKVRDRYLGNFGGEIEIDEVGVRVVSGEFDRLGLTVDGKLSWAGRQPYSVELNLNESDFSFITTAHGLDALDYGGFVVTGKSYFEGDLASATPDLVDLQIESLRLKRENDVIVSNRPMHVIYQNESVEVRSLELKYRQGVIGIEGLYRPGAETALMIKGEDFSVDALGKLFNLPDWNYDGELSIDAGLYGVVPDLNLKVNANINNFTIDNRHIPEIYLNAHGNRSEIVIDSAGINLPSSSLSVKGSVELKDYLDIKAIDLNLSIPKSPLIDLPGLLPQLLREASGTIEANLDLTGEPRKPVLSGDLRLTADKLQLSAMRTPITNLVVESSTRDQIIHLDRFEARLGRGSATGQGSINFRDGPGYLDVTLNAQKVDASWMNVELDNASASVKIGGDLYNPVIRGDVLIPRGRFNITADILKPAKPAGLILNSLDYKFNFNVPGNFWLRSSFINSEMRGKFSIAGTLDDFYIDGRVQVVKGNLFFQRQRFVIERGEMNFGGFDDTLDPTFTLKSQGQIQNTQIFLTLQGRVSSFTPRIYSSPPMSEGDILSMLAIGRDLSSIGQSENGGNFETEVFEGLKNSYISALVGTTISAALNLDELFLSSLYDQSTGKARSHVRVGKYVSKNIFVAYEGVLDESEEETYIFEYHLPRGFVVNLEFKEPEKEQRIGVKYDWRFR